MKITLDHFKSGETYTAVMLLVQHPTHDSEWLIICNIIFLDEAEGRVRFQIPQGTNGFISNDGESFAYFEPDTIATADKKDFFYRVAKQTPADDEWDAEWPPLILTK